MQTSPLAQDQALRALAEIRAVIDRTARYSRFSALSGFLAGGAALLGSGGCGLWSAFAGAQPSQGWAFIAVWSAVLAVAVGVQFFLTSLKARQRDEPLWTPVARTALATLIGPGLAGVAATAALIHSERWELLPGLWLMLYGCGLWNVSFFAPLFLRALGGVFMALGVAAWFCTAWAALWLGLGFGVLHLIFGAVVLVRYRR